MKYMYSSPKFCPQKSPIFLRNKNLSFAAYKSCLTNIQPLIALYMYRVK